MNERVSKKFHECLIPLPHPVYVFSYRAYTLKDGDGYTEMKSNLQTVREQKSVLLAKTKERSSPGLMFCESC